MDCVMGAVEMVAEGVVVDVDAATFEAVIECKLGDINVADRSE
jgi:hypothetical protein